MNSRRINDIIDKTQLTDEEKRSSGNSYNNPINNDDSDNDNDNDNDMYDDDDISPGVFSLNKVINRFGNNVELLELILTSKVEEDRRLTEEAKLKIRQLDYQKDQKRKETLSDHPPFPSTQLPRPYNHPFSTDTLLSSSDSDSTLVRRPSFFTPNHLQQNHYYTPDSNHHDDSGQHRQNQQKLHLLSIHSPLPSINALPDDKKSPHFFTAPSLSASQPLSSPSTSTSIPPPLTYSNNTQTLSSFSSFSSTHQPRPPNVTTTPSPPTLPQHHSPHKLPIPQITQSHPHHHQQEGDGNDRSTSSPSSRKQPFKRRRREMQSITMIVETSEFPYNDNYNWKNNGNTVHKKSGQRSIYYKCSNAAKGCHVNKTVTCKGQDEYLIKYRGKHLKECLKSNSDPASPVNLSNTESPSASYHT